MLITLEKAYTQGLGILFFPFSPVCECVFVWVGGCTHPSAFSYLSKFLCPD